MEEVENVIVNIEVKVMVEGDEATIVVPPELRFTERLVSFLNDALKARDLRLRHWTITVPEQEAELEKLPNVVVEEPNP